MVSFIFKKEHSYAFVFLGFFPENWDKLRHRISLTETDRHTASFIKISKTPVGRVVQATSTDSTGLFFVSLTTYKSHKFCFLHVNDKTVKSKLVLSLSSLKS